MFNVLDVLGPDETPNSGASPGKNKARVSTWLWVTSILYQGNEYSVHWSTLRVFNQTHDPSSVC